jgi:hypothetical protein
VLQERAEHAQRAEEAGLEILHRAIGSSYNRSAADLHCSPMQHLLLEERRFPVVAPPLSPSEGDAQEEEEEEEQELQPMQVSFIVVTA